MCACLLSANSSHLHPSSPCSLLLHTSLVTAQQAGRRYSAVVAHISVSILPGHCERAVQGCTYPVRSSPVQACRAWAMARGRQERLGKQVQAESLFIWRLKKPGLDQALEDWTGPDWIGAALLMRPHRLISGQNAAFKSTNSNTWKQCGDTCQSTFLLYEEFIRDSSHAHLQHMFDKYVMLLVFFLQPCVCVCLEGRQSSIYVRILLLHLLHVCLFSVDKYTHTHAEHRPLLHHRRKSVFRATWHDLILLLH